MDSILIDEARTPLIISGPSEGNSDLYKQIDKIIPQLTRQDPITNEEGQPDFGPGDFSVDEKARQLYLSEDGHQKVEDMLTEIGLLGAGESLYDPSNIALMHHVYAALRAHALFQKNVDYIVGTVRSSSSTNSPAAPCRAGAGPRVCTRPSRPRKGWRFSRRTRPWPPSPSRTCSASIPSSRA